MDTDGQVPERLLNVGDWPMGRVETPDLLKYFGTYLPRGTYSACVAHQTYRRANERHELDLISSRFHLQLQLQLQLHRDVSTSLQMLLPNG